MTATIQLPADVYEVLKEDPLYSERIRVGLKIGAVEIIGQTTKGEIPCQKVEVSA